MENRHKCFTEEHKDIDAISYCPECRNYMCNKCEKTHSSFLKNHHPYFLNKEEEIFTGYCKEKNHPNKLSYFCKNHNVLCCSACLSKLNKEGDGQHKDCDVCYIEEIKDEKKNKLKENIKLLEDLQNTFDENIKILKEIYTNIEKNKEDLKLIVQNIFTKIRNIINERETILLSEIEDIYKTKYFNEDLIKKGEKLPKQIKTSLEKGKLIDKEWDNKNLFSYINDCINIENNIKNINIINENINNYKKNNKLKIEFLPKEEQFNNFLSTLNSFGKISLNKFKFRECPQNNNDDRKYSVTGNDKNILTKTGSGGWMGTICESELDKSIEEHKWKIKILKTVSKYIMIGVAPIDFDINSTEHYHSCGWYLYCYNSNLHSGPPFNLRGTDKNLSKVNDEVIVVFNFKKRALKFIINNEDKGDCYTDIPIDKPLFPAVLLDTINDSVEISEVE